MNTLLAELNRLLLGIKHLLRRADRRRHFQFQPETLVAERLESRQMLAADLQLIMPMYQYPLSTPNTLNSWWQEVRTTATADTPITIIANPNSGPIDPVHASYSDWIEGLTQLRENPNVKILGYVKTRVAPNSPIVRPVAEILTDVSRYGTAYKHPTTGASLIDGIFLDEMSNQGSDVATYSTVATAVRSNVSLAGQFVVGNPGTTVPSIYLDQQTADLFIVREGTPADLLNNPSPSYVTESAYADLDFGAVIHSAAGNTTLADMLREVKLRELDFVFITDDSGANPFDESPSYFPALVRDVHAPFISAAPFNIAENSAFGTVVGTPSSGDPDADQTIQFILISGNTDNAFAIDSATGQITVNNPAALDFEATPEFVLKIQVSDNAVPALTDVVDIQISLIDIDENVPVLLIDDGDPGFSTVGGWNDVMDYGFGTPADAKSATGSNGSKVATWNFTGLTDGEYRIDATWLNGNDRANNAPYIFRNASNTQIGSATISQRVRPSGAQPESGRPFQTIGTVIVAGGTLRVELANAGTNGAIIADAVRIERIGDGVPNTAPTDINLSSSSVPENEAVGTIVGTFSTVDPDTNNVFSYSFVSGTGSADNGSFTIDGNGNLLTAEVFDHETKTEYSVRVRSTDQGGLFVEKVFLISVTDVAEVPEITVRDGAVNVADGSIVNMGTAAVGSAVLSKTFTVSNDGNANLILQPLQLTGAGYSLASPNFTADQILVPAASVTFTVHVDTSTAGAFIGQATFGNSDTDENPFEINLAATIVPAVTVLLIDDGDPGFSTVGGWNNVLNYGFGTPADAKAATGSDGTKVATWNFTGLTDGEYRIDATWLNGNDRADNAPYVFRNTSGTQIGSATISQRVRPSGAQPEGGRPFQTIGTVIVAGGTLRVELANSGSNGAIIADAVRIERIGDGAPNTAPTDINLSSSSVPENEAAGTIVGTFSTVDPDTNNVFSYSFVSGTGNADNGSFSIDGNGNLLTAEVFDFETRTEYSIRVRSTDQGGLFVEKVFLISVTNVAEAPEITVRDGAVNVADGSIVNMGTAAVGSAVLSKTFTVSNEGNANLILQPLQLTGAGYSLASPNFIADQILAPAASVTFTVDVDTSTAGAFIGQAAFDNSDTDENPFEINLAATIVPVVTVLLIDDGDPGFSTVGGWNNVLNYGFGTPADAKAATGSDGTKVATWNFTGLTDGEYRIDATWLNGNDRADNAPYVFRNASGTQIGSATISQRVPASGAQPEGGRPFQTIGTAIVTGGTLRVELANAGTNGAIIADAVRIERIGDACVATGLSSHGGEMLVNTTTFDDQFQSAVASADDGSYVVVWTSTGADGSGNGIFGRRYAANGSPMGIEFPVNEITDNDQTDPAIAMMPDGRFVVTWQNTNSDGSGFDIVVRRFDASGAPLGNEFLVNTHTPDLQRFPSVAINTNGEFVITWQSDHQDDSNGVGIHAQRFAADATPIGDEIPVNFTTEGDQRNPVVALADDGRFVIVWQSNEQEGMGYGVYLQRFDSTGAPVDEEFLVNTETFNDQYDAAVAMADDSRFMVTWTSTTTDGDGDGIAGQVFDADGNPVGDELIVNTHTNDHQRFSSVAAAAHGHFVVTWQSDHQDDLDGVGIHAQLVDGKGNKVGGEILVNETTEGDQRFPAVSTDGCDNVVIVWQSDEQDGSGFGIYSRTFKLE